MKLKINKRQLGFIAAGILIVVLHNMGGEKEYNQQFYAMDTTMSITAYGKQSQLKHAIEESVGYINTLEAEISRTRENSQIYELNHAEGKPIQLSEQTADILSDALMLAEKTKGNFDPSIAPVSDLWGIGSDHAAIPTQEKIDAVLPLVDHTKVKLMETTGEENSTMTAQLQKGMEIDLGGIGKGYAADHVIAILQRNGIQKAIVALGGNVYVLGEKDKDTPWSIGITDPDAPETYFAALALSDATVVTSGDYERYLEVNGRRYCHIFDPKTGFSADTDLRSVTVVSKDSTSADAYSTALFVMGYEKAKAFCAENKIEAVLVRNDRHVFVTDGLKDSFTLEDTKYTYES